MKPFGLLVLCSMLSVMIPLSCTDDGGIDPKVAALYKMRDRITPLSEYTEDNPREWGRIAEEHIPRAKMSSDRGMEAIVIRVPLKKPSPSHYIERIGILDAKGKEIVSEAIPRLPNPKTHAFFLTRDLPADRSKLKIFIKCNLHDRWTVPFEDARWED